MGSKLRPLYDKLYIRVETWLNAQEAIRSCKKSRKELGPVPGLDKEYGTLVRPYWQQFKVSTPKKYWFARYSAAGRLTDPRFIPEDLWFDRIIPFYNNLIFAKGFQDKCMLNVFFPELKRPVTAVKNIAGVFYSDELSLLTREEAVALCRGRGRILAKPSVGTGKGHNIRFYDSDALSDGDIEDIFRSYDRNFVVQEKMDQHPDLARFNPHSLNTIRVLTFLHGGQVHVLSAVLRIGGEGSEVDNVSQGGYQCSVQPDGHLESTAIIKQNGRWERTDVCAAGVRFGDAVIPSYERIIAAVSASAARMAHFPILGWDIAVDPDGDPVLIEYNAIPGQNQGTSGPTFGDMTDEVLTEIFGRRR